MEGWSDYLTWLDDPTYDEWKAKAKRGIIVYMQLARDFGWDCYKQVAVIVSIFKVTTRSHSVLIAVALHVVLYSI